MNRNSLPDDRTGFTQRFSLPYKRDDGLPEDIKQGLRYLKSLGEDPAQLAAQPMLRPALNWINAITEDQPKGERMKVYFNVGVYPDGKIGEVFIKADRSGSLASGALDAVAMMMSIALQYGVPLKVLVDKLRHLRFEPEGWTQNPDYPRGSSVLDLLAQWLIKKFPAQAGEPEQPQNA